MSRGSNNRPGLTVSPSVGSSRFVDLNARQSSASSLLYPPTLRLRHDVLQEGPWVASGAPPKSALPSQEEGVAGRLGSDLR
jgi:hypothetical protein